MPKIKGILHRLFRGSMPFYRCGWCTKAILGVVGSPLAICQCSLWQAGARSMVWNNLGPRRRIAMKSVAYSIKGNDNAPIGA